MICLENRNGLFRAVGRCQERHFGGDVFEVVRFHPKPVSYRYQALFAQAYFSHEFFAGSPTAIP